MLKELVSQAPVGRLMKGLLLPALSLVGFIASAQSPTVHWTHTVQPERWYRSVNPLTYHAEGADPLTCQEIVDGTARETAQTHDGEIPVGGWGQGWHVFGVRATNASGHAVTPPWRGGWDETPGTAILLPEGAQTGIWNRPDARVVVRLDDQHSGARRFRYRWDNGEFSQWFINPNPPRNDGTKRPPFAGQIPLLPGTHVLVVQVEDETFTGAEMLGNRESYSLGEFKMDAVRPVVTAMSFDPPSPSAAEHITVSVEATDEGSGVHHIDLFRNDMRIGTVNAASGQVVWNTAGLPGGEYHIRSVAFDRAGNASEPRIAPYVLNRGGGGTPVLAGLQIRPAEVVGGYTTTGTVGLTAPAGEGGAVITITDNSTAVQTPETVTIPAGAHVKSFTIGTSAVVELTRRNVTATYEGVSRTAVITLLPAGLYSFTIQPAEVFGGQHTTGTLRLSRPAGEGGVVVAISDNSSAILTPESVRVPQGAYQASFRIDTLRVQEPVTRTVNATLDGVTRSAHLTLRPGIFLHSITVSPSTIVGGHNTTGTLTLTAPAPPEGARVQVWSPSTAIMVPESVLIPAGQTTATFTIHTRPVGEQVTRPVYARFNETRVAQITLTRP